MPSRFDTESHDFRFQVRVHGRCGQRMCHFDDSLQVDLGELPVRFVGYSGVRLRSEQGPANQAPSNPLSRGIGCANRVSHLRQRRRVDGILIDEMSFWDSAAEVVIELRDTTKVD